MTIGCGSSLLGGRSISRKTLFLVFVLTGICLGIAPNSNERANMIEPHTVGLFENIEPDNHNENECTPRIEEDFIGIRIVAQEVINYMPGQRNRITGAFGRAILCGIYRLDSVFLAQTNGFRKTATLIAVDTKTHVPYSVNMVHDHPEIPNPNPSQIPLEKFRSVVTGYFNINMLDFLRLPEQPATYNVFVTFGQFKSNVVTVRLVPQD